ncbi:uncharacterized protein ACBT44_000977 isoform 2-T5 [Syngnathus typhle]
MTSPLEEYKRRQKIETLILLLTSDGVTSCCSARISTRPLTSLKSVKMHFERATAYTLLACKLKSLQWRWHRRLLRPYCAPKRRTRECAILPKAQQQKDQIDCKKVRKWPTCCHFEAWRLHETFAGW